MDNFLLDLNCIIKKEADQILVQEGLLSILELYGTPHISGSYSLDLMTWRDLDIYLEVKGMCVSRFFDLGAAIAAALNPLKMNFRNEVLGKTEGLPDGFYWGIYLGDERKGAWKIDIWAVDSAECSRLLRYCSGIRERLTPIKTLRILDIKSHCWKDPEYRRSYSSTDIYDAVLENNISDMEGFRDYLNKLR